MGHCAISDSLEMVSDSVTAQKSETEHSLSLSLSLSILKLKENPMADQNLKPELFELNNGTMRVLITNLGCTITSLSVPDKDGIFIIYSFANCQAFSFIIISFWVCGNVADVWFLWILKANWLMLFLDSTLLNHIW